MNPMMTASGRLLLAGLCLSSPAVDFALKVPAWKSLLGRVASRLLPGLSLHTRALEQSAPRWRDESVLRANYGH